MKKLKHILLIDDDYPTNFLHEIILKETGLVENIDACTSVDKAIEHIIEKDKIDESPELIFIDINLPAKNGFQFVEEFDQLEQSLKDKSTIIMFSTSENPSDIQKSKSYSSIKDIMVKPLSESILSTIIEKFF